MGIARPGRALDLPPLEPMTPDEMREEAQALENADRPRDAALWWVGAEICQRLDALLSRGR